MLRRGALVLLVAVWGAALGSMATATDEPIQTLSPAGGSDDVVVGMDTEGTATAVWTERGTVHYGMRKLGGRFGTPVPIPGAESVDVLVFDESNNGNAVIGFQNGESVVAAVRIGPDSGFGPAEISATIPSGNFPRFPDVAASDSGRAIAAWQQTGADGSKIMAAVYDGDQWSAPAELDAINGELRGPDVAMTSDGAALVVWSRNVSDNPAIMGASAPATGTFGQTMRIESLDQGPGEPRLDVNATGAAILAYDDAVPAGSSCTGGSCAPFRLETRYGNVSGTFGPVQETPIGNQAGFGVNAREVAIDDDGKAAVLMSMTTPGGGVAVAARVSDTAGTLGPVQTLSTAQAVSGPGVGDSGMDLAGWGGEFTAVFINDHNGDGQVNEVYRSHTSDGTFGEVHQLTPTATSSPDDAGVARDTNGNYVAVWDIFFEELVPQALPVGTGSSFTQGTEVDDDLKGASTSDLTFLAAGNDAFNAAGGNDEVFGEEGNDDLGGAGGKDKLDGGPGSDLLAGGPGKDKLNGGPGKDTCVKSEGDTYTSCERFKRNNM